MGSGLGRGGGGGCWLGCPSSFSFFFFFFIEEEEEEEDGGIPSNGARYCVGPSDVSECLYLPVLVGKVESRI